MCCVTRLRFSTRSNRRMAFCVCGFQVGEILTISALSVLNTTNRIRLDLGLQLILARLAWEHDHDRIAAVVQNRIDDRLSYGNLVRAETDAGASLRKDADTLER